MIKREQDNTQIVMEKAIIRHRVAIAGRVMNAQTQQAIAGAQITLSEIPDKYRSILKLKAMQYRAESWEKMRPDRTYADQDGYYFFRNLPVGDYTLVASFPKAGTRYGSATQSVTVVAGSETSGVIHVDLCLSPTGVQGKITAPENEKFIAKVRIQGQNEYALTNGDGEYLLTGVEASSQEVTLVISASGYELNLSPELYPPKISLLQGQVLTEQNFHLKRKAVTNGISTSANRSPP
ncbi:carboxypeptidase regulatory-like domain-containing protein [Pseudanabaena minima]|uniref:carboxypeptidase regulatory-like domain-containing protein n=1 Tax=Pseudanabaena minima TaxID=890415 RepID=UPI003DA99695